MDSYTDRRFDGDFTPREFDDIPVGFVLQTEFPGIIATYRRHPIGEVWSDGVECRPGSIRGRGWRLVYGKEKFESARIEASWTQFDIVVKPRWDPEVPPYARGASPLGYDFLVENYRLPTPRVHVRSARQLMKRARSVRELYGSTKNMLMEHPPLEVDVGLSPGLSIVISAEDADAKQQLQEAIDEQIMIRVGRRGLPIQMIRESQELISSMPAEFRSAGFGTREDFKRWIKPE